MAFSWKTARKRSLKMLKADMDHCAKIGDTKHKHEYEERCKRLKKDIEDNG